MKQQPLVSILLPICNSRHFLSDCLKSLLSQSYKNLEIIAIDDYSKDKSYQLLKTFKKKDKRLRAYKNKKRYGTAICLNRAIRKAKGTFLAFMDPSDISTPDRIKRQVSFLLSHPKIVIVGTQTVFMSEHNKKAAKSSLPTDHYTITKSFLSGLSLHFETAMINKTMLPKDILYFKENKYPYLYSEVVVKLLAYGEAANLPWALYYHRRIPDTSRILTELPMLLKHLAKSIALYDYRPSFFSLLTGSRTLTNISR